MDQRPISERVRALARRFDAMGIGFAKRYAAGDPRVSIQDSINAIRDATVLHQAANQLEASTRASRGGYGNGPGSAPDDGSYQW